MTGCNKDDSPANQFTFNGETYSFSQGIVFNETIVPDSMYYHMVVLLSDDFTVYWDEDHEDIDSLTGRGEALVLGMIGPEADGPATGTYLHADLDLKKVEMPNLFVWVEGRLYINYSEDEEKGEELNQRYKLTDGTVKVSKKGSGKFDFTFDLSVADTNATSLKGFSSVTLEIVNIPEEDEDDPNKGFSFPFQK